MSAEEAEAAINLMLHSVVQTSIKWGISEEEFCEGVRAAYAMAREETTAERAPERRKLNRERTVSLAEWKGGERAKR